MKKVYIYSLKDPRTNEVRYIGKANNPTLRLFSHLSGRSSKANQAWFSELASCGLAPVMEIVEETDESGWVEAEKKWIASGRELGWNLTNISDGGTGGNGIHRTPEEIEADETIKTTKGYLSGDARTFYSRLPKSRQVELSYQVGNMFIHSGYIDDIFILHRLSPQGGLAKLQELTEAAIKAEMVAA